ncbi:MAG: acetate--CoA ligase family protein [Deltaproteobacteria bacterium]|nr:acetate--CoA ligase family protein [Deltaproteobacteria bacterium]
MKKLFNPSSVVVIGVSADPRNLGKEIARNLFEFLYTGVIHLVGLDEGVLFGRKIHKTLDEIDEPIDLAVILTPARTVPDILEECGKKGITRAVIESGGFGEYGGKGSEWSQSLKRIAAQYGIRFIGPNCIGIMNASNGLATPFPRLRNTFRAGGVGIIAQSGGVALSFLNMFDSEQLGFSKFASIGNKLNINENDLLEYYIEDPETSVICMYLESIQDGRRFTDLAKKSSKPIVVHKANIGGYSQHVAQSHTDALANDDMVVDAALVQSGVIRFRDMHGYVDFVKILQISPMKGRNLAIISRSGGHAVIAADAAYTYGFNLPPFNEDFLDQIRQKVRANVIKLANPLDLGDLFDFEIYVQIIEHTLKEPNVDGVLLLQTYFAAIEGETSRQLLREAASLSERYQKPVALCVSTEQVEVSRLFKEFDFPIFNSPERAVSALDTAIKFEKRRELIRQETSKPPKPVEMNQPAISRIIDRSISEGRSPLLHEALHIMRLAKLDLPDDKVILPFGDLDSVMPDFPGPYAVKVIASEISHKSDSKGVILGLSDFDQLKTAVRDIQNRFMKEPSVGYYGCLVQRMAAHIPGTYELIVGGKRDAQFGPLVLVGYGGVLVEVFAKASLRMAPLSDREIDEMIDELPGSDIFRGVRGRDPIDRESLRRTISTVASLMVEFPSIDQIDVNPVWVSRSGAIALDARIFLKVSPTLK